MNTKQIITVGIAVMTMGAFALDNVEVTNVKARQRYPWNGKVDIDFKLDSNPTEAYQMEIVVFDNIGKTNLPVKCVSQEGVSAFANPCMVNKDARRVVWNATADLPNGFKCTNVLVSCHDERVNDDQDRYMIVDLSTFSVSGEYGISYTNRPPSGGWTGEFKTSKIVLRKVLPGSFMMGSPDTEVGRQTNEDYHRVTLTKAYYLSIYEVTEAQWDAVFGSSSTSCMPSLKNYVTIRGTYKTRPDAWSYYSKSDTCWPDTEAIDMTSFMGLLRERTTIKTFDLPTEAQWECAARGGCLLAVNNGKDWSQESINCVGRNVNNRSDGKGNAASSATTYVGCYEPNSLGIYDMLGNSPEWCVDAYQGCLGTEDAVDPKGGPAVLQRYDGTWIYHVLKGGGYIGGHYMTWLGSLCGPTYNYCFTPTHAHRSAARATTTGTNGTAGGGDYSDNVLCAFRIMCYAP